MAVEARDGSMHHSAGRAKLHNETKGAGASVKKAAPKPAAAGGKTHPAPSPHSIQDHVATHGPAVEIHIVHDKATGKHHVTSHHGEGGTELHHSVHSSPEDVQSHMATAMGMNEGEQTPDELGGESPEETASTTPPPNTGGGIPGLT